MMVPSFSLGRNDCLLASFSTETVVGWKMTLHAHLLAHMSLEMRQKKTFVYCLYVAVSPFKTKF